ncbi:hypothetical protein GCM10010266_61430 [Streptomyces griseomycini]|nr:hypothetical protein GCM10010266_61430 [Streptomyces griseomycini]
MTAGRSFAAGTAETGGPGPAARSASSRFETCGPVLPESTASDGEAGPRSANKEFNEILEGMRFLLEVTMDGEALTKDPAGELGRILRYWAGNLRHYPLEPGDGSVVYDSEYREAGRWAIETETEGEKLP